MTDNTAIHIERQVFRWIKQDIATFGGSLPEPVALAWRGYVAGLLEWGAISISGHQYLWGLLPPIEDDPVMAILSGRPSINQPTSEGNA